MEAVNKRDAEATKQIANFKKTARELGCDESEAIFDKAMGKIGKAKPAPSAKRKPKKTRV
jgi:hypothetical protein